jgi:hypothetical protein
VRNAQWPDDYLPFPNHLINSQNDREALLVFLAKLDAVAWAMEWTHGFLGGMFLHNS